MRGVQFMVWRSTPSNQDGAKGGPLKTTVLRKEACTSFRICLGEGKGWGLGVVASGFLIIDCGW